MQWYLERDNEWVSFVFNDAEVHITSDSGRDETQSFDSQNDAVAAMRRVTRELFDDGYKSRVPPDQRFQQDPEIQRWWKEEFEKALVGVNDAQPVEGRGLKAKIAADRNTTFSPDLERFLDIRDRYSFGWTNYNEWRVWDEDLDVPDFGVSNRFEQLILLDQANYLGTAMAEAFMGGVFIGTAGNGDSYFALNGEDPGRSEVVMWDHDEASISAVIADSVSSFAYLNHVLGMVHDEEGEFSEEDLLEAAERLQGKVNPSWHYNSIGEETEVEFEYESNCPAEYFYWRMAWVDYLLRQNSVVGMEDISNYFLEQIHSGLHWEETLQYHHVRQTPETQFYWLWRLFWFDKPELSQMLEIADEAPSPLVRDCAALIRELINGRKELGKIKDIHAWRQKFLDLDLDPDRAEDRMREEMEHEQRMVLESAQRLEKAHDLIAEGDRESVVAATWEHLDQRETLDVFFEYLASVDPDVAYGLKLIDFIEHASETRPSVVSVEIEEVKEELGFKGKSVLPLILAKGWWSVAARTGDPRAFEGMVEKLGLREKYHHTLKDVVIGLARMPEEGRRRAVDVLRPMILEFNWDEGDYMSEIENKDVMRALLETVSTLGETTDDVSEIRVVTEGGPEALQIVALKSAARLLARLGAEEDWVYEKCEELLDGDLARPALFALSEFGTKRAGELISACVGKISGASNVMAYERVMQQRWAKRAGEPVNAELVDFASKVIEKSKFVDLELHLAVVELLGALDADFAETRLLQYLSHHHVEVRDLARSELSKRGVSATYCTRAFLEYTNPDEGELIALLQSPSTVYKFNLVHWAVDHDLSDAFYSELARELPSIVRYTHYNGGYVSYYHNNFYYLFRYLLNLDRHELEEVLGELLSRPVTMYAHDLDKGRVAELKAAHASKLASKGSSSESAVWERLGDPRWLCGGNVHGVAIPESGVNIFVATTNGLVVFEPEGRVVGSTESRWLYDVQVSGEHLALSGHHGFFALLRVNDLSARRAISLSGGVRKARFSKDGKFVIAVTDHRNWYLIDVATADIKLEGKDPQDINGIDWLDDSTFVYATDTSVVVMNTNGKELARKRFGAMAEVRVGPDSLIYAGTPKGIERLNRDLSAAGESLKQTSVSRIEFRGAGHLVAASWDGKDTGVWVWDVKKAKRRRAKGHEDSGVFGLALDSDGHIYAGGNKSTLERWDAKDKLIANPIPGHTKKVEFLGRGRASTLLSVGGDQKIVEWDVGAGLPTFEAGLDFRVCCARWSDDVLYVSGTDNLVAMNSSGEEIWRSDAVRRSEYLEVYQNQIIAASRAELVWLDRATGKETARSGDFTDSFIYRWVRMNEKTLIVAGYDDVSVYVVDLETREVSKPLAFGGSERLRDIAKLDEERVVLTHWGEKLKVFNVTTGKIEKVVKEDLSTLAVSADGDIHAWKGGKMFILKPDGELKSPVETPAAEKALWLEGRLFLGGPTGAVHRMS